MNSDKVEKFLAKEMSEVVIFKSSPINGNKVKIPLKTKKTVEIFDDLEACVKRFNYKSSSEHCFINAKWTPGST